MIDRHFVILGALISLSGSIGYVIATVRGRAAPNRVTWFFWAAAPLIGFFAQLQDGVGFPAVMTLSVGLGPALVFVGSFWTPKAYWRLSGFDIGCGAMSAIAIVAWQALNNPTLAVLLAVLADLVAGLPTFVKAYRTPLTEHAGVFRNTAINGAITLLTIDHWTLASWPFPVYIVLLGCSLYLLIKLDLGDRIRSRTGARRLSRRA